MAAIVLPRAGSRTDEVPHEDKLGFVILKHGECELMLQSRASLAGKANAEAIAIRPLLGEGASAKLAVERLGARPVLLGWFRDFETAYPRTYWLPRPVEFGADARLSSDGACQAALVLRAPR